MDDDGGLSYRGDGTWAADDDKRFPTLVRRMHFDKHYADYRQYVDAPDEGSPATIDGFVIDGRYGCSIDRAELVYIESLPAVEERKAALRDALLAAGWWELPRETQEYERNAILWAAPIVVAPESPEAAEVFAYLDDMSDAAADNGQPVADEERGVIAFPEAWLKEHPEPFPRARVAERI